MRPSRRWWPKLAVFLGVLAACLLAPAASAAQAGGPTGTTGGGSPGSGRVLVVPISGNIETGLARFLGRAFDRAEAIGADLILLEINTPGGRVDAALEIVDRILQSPIPVAAYVPGRAWSAGALLAIAAPRIVMAPGSSIGAAEPRPAEEKIISALRAEFEAVAEKNGRDPTIAAAMVDADVEIPGLVAKGKILTLTAEAARERGYADAIAATREGALEALGLAPGAAEVQEIGPSTAERIARFITDPVVAPLLLSLGFLGLLAEITSPGWGVPGSLGLLALGLFFGGHFLAGFAGWEVILLFVVGLLLIAVEFVVPGFGIFGIAGIAAVVTSIIFASASVEQALRSLGLSLVLSVGFGIVLARQGVRRGWWRRLILGEAVTGRSGYVDAHGLASLVGQEGTTLTPFRPAGTVAVGGRRLDAVSEGDFIPAGHPVVVVAAEGWRLIVRPAAPGGPTDGGSGGSPAGPGAPGGPPGAGTPGGEGAPPGGEAPGSDEAPGGGGPP